MPSIPKDGHLHGIESGLFFAYKGTECFYHKRLTGAAFYGYTY